MKDKLGVKHEAIFLRCQRGFVMVLAIGGLAFYYSDAGAAVLVTNLAYCPESGSDGSVNANVIQARDGCLYGPLGQNDPIGGVFRVTPDGTVSNFPSDRQNTWPNRMFQGRDGNLYGTANGEDFLSTNYGTVFRFTTNGTFTTLATFNGTNGSIPCDLVQTADGSLFGTTLFGGAGFTNVANGVYTGFGTLFKIDTNGALTTMFYFNGTNGGGPGPLVVGSDGNIYGATEYGGTDTNQYYSLTAGEVAGYGTAFVLHPDGSVTVPGFFTVSNNFGGIVSSLILGCDGNVYGTAEFGGAYNVGTVFEFTTNETLSLIATFDNTNGAYPLAMLQTADGDFYGSAHGRAACYPNLFRVSSGTVIPIFTFAPAFPSGPYPVWDLIQGTNGLFYGVGGPGGAGFVFQISAPVAPVLQTATPASGNVSLTWNSVPQQTYQVQYASSPSQMNWTNLGSAIMATNGTLSLPDSPGPAQQRFYRVVITP